MADATERQTTVPEKFEPWKEGDKHEPFSVRNRKVKDKKAKEESKNYQANYRETKKALISKKKTFLLKRKS